MSERDTHFRGFAKLLWDEIEAKIRGTYDFIPEGERLRRDFLPMMHELIAQRVYDLEYFIFESESVQDVLDPWEVFNGRTDFKGSLLPRIPDMAEWPEEKKSE